MIIPIWSLSKHPWWWLPQINPCPNILDVVDSDSINIQASLMMIIAIWSESKHHWWWLLQLINVQISLMMLIKTLLMSKHTWWWWWWWRFDQCTSILEDDHWDLIHVSKPIFGKNYQGVSCRIQAGFSPGRWHWEPLLNKLLSKN